MEITTQNGTVLELCAVSEFYITSIRNKARSDFVKDQGELLVTPTYVTVCGGGLFDTWEEENEHTKDTIETGTDAEKHAWKLFTAQQGKLSTVIWMRTARAYLLRGVKTEPPDNGWRARQEGDGLEIPDNPDDLRQHWIETETVLNAYELGMIISTIRQQSNQIKEARQLAADNFRRSVELAGRSDAQ